MLLVYYRNINHRKSCNFAPCKEIVISQSFENLQFNYQQMVIRRNSITDEKKPICYLMTKGNSPKKLKSQKYEITFFQ